MEIKNLSMKNSTLLLLVLAILSFAIYLAPIGIFNEDKGKLKYDTISPEHILSGAYKVYGQAELGKWAAKTVITNEGDKPLYNLKVYYKLGTYADWAEAGSFQILLPESTVVALYYPVLSGTITQLSASTPANIELKITYSHSEDGDKKEITDTKPITLLGGHDFIFTSIPPEESTGTFAENFNNYPFLAAWVTPSDPVVVQFADMGNALAGGAGAALSDEDAWASLQGMWTLSVINGITYKTEQQGFWTGKFSQYVKYPRDVIKERSGTCLDTAIFFASLAMSQGLKAYVILMTGHAFPVIELPSGNLVPVESTALNWDATFDQAVESGIQTYEEAMAGPNLWIDISTLQSEGVVPPELESLPTDALAVWGITSGGSGGVNTGGNGNGGNGNNGGSAGLTETYTNNDPGWSIKYGDDWQISEYTGEVDFYPPSGLEVIVWWMEGYTKNEVRDLEEDIMVSIGSFETIQEDVDNVDGVNADLVMYSGTLNSNGKDLTVVARYFNQGGYGYAVLYDFYDDSSADQNLALGEETVSTFSLG